MTSVVKSPSFQVQDVVVVNEGKAGVHIRTGIGYLDHMLDQLNSHAQVGVGLKVVVTATTSSSSHSDDKGSSNGGHHDETVDANRLAGQNQVQLCTDVGRALGEALYRDVLSTTTFTTSSTTTAKKSRFCCPLDEALVECTLEPATAAEEDSTPLIHYDLAPYGIFPRNGGRTHIGALETFALESFWRALAESSRLKISLRKVRGDNAHHIVESSFKAFSRALRNYLDPVDLWNISGPNHCASVALQREGRVERSTKETSISVRLLLSTNPGTENDSDEMTRVDTGIPTLDAFYETLAREAHMTLQIKCEGDLWVDDHHTAEDVSIAVGQCLTQALGSKAGLNRMWLASAPAATPDGATATITPFLTNVEVTMDLSNRPCLRHNLHETLGRQEYVEGVEAANGSGNGNRSRLTCEMFEHCLDSLVMNARMTVHIVETQQNENKRNDNGNVSNDGNVPSVLDVALCTAKAFGRALRVCAMVDPRRAGTTASSKGTLSI